jgi:uncharacterized protein (TIGR03437 family)
MRTAIHNLQLRRLALLAVLLLPTARAQQQIITTVVGTDWLPAIDGKAALDVPFSTDIVNVATDVQGYFYVADHVNGVVVRAGPDGVAHVVAGNGIVGNSGDGGPATSASIDAWVVAIDDAGSLYIGDLGFRQIRKVGRDGLISTIAGAGVSANGGAFTGGIHCLGFDAAKNLLFCNGNNQIYKVSPDGSIPVVAGSGKAGYSGDGGPAASAMLSNPAAVVSDRAGAIYVADSFNGVIRRINPDGTIATFAGNGRRVFAGDGGPAAAASFITPTGLAIDGAGNVYVADVDSCRIRMIDASGVVTTVAGNGSCAHAGDGGPPLKASFFSPYGIALDTAGRLLVLENGTGQTRAITLGASVQTVAGNNLFHQVPDGTPATQAFLQAPQGVAMDAAGNLYVSDTHDCVIRKRTVDGLIQTIAGSGVCNAQQAGPGGVAALTLALGFTQGLAIAPDGDLVIAAGGNMVVALGVDGIVRPLAGGGGATGGFSGDGSAAVQAGLNLPSALAYDSAGNLYIADSGNNRIRKVTASGTITTFAGNGIANSLGDGGPATDASLNDPRGIAIDAEGDVYIGEFSGFRIRKVTLDGKISTFAGTGTSGNTGDGGPANRATVGSVVQMVCDAQGNLYFSQQGRPQVRRIATDGTINTVAGSGLAGFLGDLGPASLAELSGPWGLAIGPDGAIYITDANNNRVRAVTQQTPPAQASTPALTFNASSGGVLAPPQRIVVQAGGAALPYTATATTQDGTWLSLQSASGLTPAAITVNADPTQLAPGIHNATVTIRIPNANPGVLTVNVVFSVGPALPPKLQVDSPRLSFVVVQGGAPAQGVLDVKNAGGNFLSFQASAATDWLTPSPAGGNATPVTPARMTLTVNPGALPGGVYRDSVTVASPTTGEQVSLPVTLLVSAAQSQLLLSQTGLTFQAAADGSSPPSQRFSVLNRGPGSVDWTASATSDGGWLSISESGGSVDGLLLDASTIAVSADPTGLPSGLHYGRIAVSGGDSTVAQSVTVVLNVLAAGTSLPPQVLPAGLIFTGHTGASPGSQNLAVRNPGDAPMLYNSTRTTLDGSDWLQYIPQNATVTTEQPQQVVVQPGFAPLSAGVHEGAITFLFGDGSIGVVRVNGVVGGPGCTPKRLILLPVSVPQVFTVTQYLPQSIEVQVVDDCGVALTADRTGAAVTVTLSNGDRSLSLIPTGNGFWSNTWQPVNGSNGPVYVTVAAGLGPLTSTQVLEADLTGSTDVPQVSTVVNAASLAPDAPVAPGSLVEILGTNLTGGTVQTGGKPLQVISGSATKIVAVVPSDAAVNTELQFTAERGAAISLPQSVVIAAASPAVFTQDGSGQGAGTISDAVSGKLNSLDNPAQARDTVVISSTGLGVGPVTVSIGGQSAEVLNVLAAGMPGVYQVSVVVPDGVSGDTVPVLVIAGGQTSPVVNMVVR